MEDSKYDVQAIKKWLEEYRDIEREIENKSEALERLTTKLIGIGAQEITDMPRSPSPPLDRVTDLLNRKIELEIEIGEDIAAHAQQRKDILTRLKALPSADERAVIRFRYLMCLSWNDVADALFGGSADYLDKEDSYLRRVTNLHGKALLDLAVQMDCRRIR